MTAAPRALDLARAVAIIALVLFSTVLWSQTSDQPGKVFELASSLAIVSDYRYRGLSLSDGHPAIQADATLSLPAGFYADLWGSTVAHQDGAIGELDFTIGRQFQVRGLDIDVSIARYGFIKASQLGYVEIPLSLSRTSGPWTWTAGAAYAPSQRGTGTEPTGTSTAGPSGVLGTRPFP